jgi:hypothetical protein
MEIPDKYDIMRWDVVMFKNSVTQNPMIYIKPDEAFLEFARLNNYTVMVQIKGTGTIYDDKLIAGIVNESSNVPNCRPNFFDKTGYYVITLYSDWYGYPESDKLYSETKEGEKSLGCAMFSGLHDPENKDKDKDTDQHSLAPLVKKDAPNSKTASSTNDKGMNTWRILSVCLMIIIILLLCQLYLIK